MTVPPRAGRALGGWVSRRWHELGRRPTGNAVPGTLSVVVVTLLVGGLHLVLTRAYVAWPQDPRVLALDLLGTGCITAAAAALYHLCARLGLEQAGRLLAVALLLIDPDLLGTLTDPLAALLLAGLLGALAGLSRWATATRTPSGGELAVYVGVPATAAVFAGPEGWLLVLAAGSVVALVQVRRGHGASSALTRALCVGSVPVLVGGWWLLRAAARAETAPVFRDATDPALATGTAIALACLLVTVPVLAGLAGLLRAERRRQDLREGVRAADPAYPLAAHPPQAPPEIPRQRGVEVRS